MILKRRGPGRPRDPNAKRERITIRVTEKTKANLQARAAEIGISTQMLANRLFRKALRDAGYEHDPQ